MKKHFIKYLAAIVFVNLICFATNASAWGPERPTFTMESPATYPVFNSITNNPTIGDERDFVRVGEIRSDVTSLKNEVEIIPGKQYLVYIYFHNNASATYNDAAHNRAGVAVRTRMSTFFPTVLTAGEKGKVSATITADNSNPTSVWDEAYFTTKTSKVLLSYVSGSAKIYNDWEANGSIMPSTLFTSEGTLIGLNALNGVIPGCEEYHGVVSYVVEAKELSGSIEKTASRTTIAPGEEVEFKLTIKNTGDVGLTNVVVKDSLPAGLTLVSGSVRLSANNSTTSDQLSDNLVTTGYNLGRVGTGNTAYITYRAKAGGNFDCTGSSVTNTATLIYDSDQTSGDSRTASSTITVKKTDGCDPTPTPDPGPDPTPDPEEPPHGLLNKTASKTIMAADEEVEFRLTIKNIGNTALTNVIVKDILPSGLTLVSGSARLFGSGSAASIKLSDSLTTAGYRIARIEAGKTFYITYRAVASGDFDCEGIAVTNTATITYDNIQPSDSGNTTASTTIKVRKTENCNEPEPSPEDPNAEIAKTASKASATIDEEIEFKLVIKNTGSVNLTNVVVKDALPTGLVFVSGSAKLSSEDSTIVTDVPDEIATTGYNLGGLDVGKTITITYRAKADEGFDCTGSSVTNTATLTYDGGQASGKTASSTITVKKIDGCSEPTDPEEDRPTEIVQTGPLEVTLAVVVIGTIAGAGGYYWYTHRTLKTVKDKVSGNGPEPSDPKNDTK